MPMLKKRLLLLAICTVFTFYALKPTMQDLSAQYYYLMVNPRASIKCYRNLTADTLHGRLDPPADNAIFFHETSCNSFWQGEIVINARQACAVESAARLNPQMQVYLLYASPGQFGSGGKSAQFLKVLQQYRNVHIVHINFGEYLKGTPVEELYSSGKLETSGFAQSHASDLLRYVTLWKYGGIYLDLDVIVIKPLAQLGTNFVGIESPRNVAAGVLSFESSGTGHQLATQCLLDLQHNFNGHDWGNNGPGVVSRLARRLCNERHLGKMSNRSCQGFKIYGAEAFYAVKWQEWAKFMSKEHTDQVLAATANSYVIHVWNKYSASVKVSKVDNDTAYVIYAQKFCPQVFQQVKVEF